MHQKLPMNCLNLVLLFYHQVFLYLLLWNSPQLQLHLKVFLHLYNTLMILSVSPFSIFGTVDGIHQKLPMNCLKSLLWFYYQSFLYPPPSNSPQPLLHLKVLSYNDVMMCHQITWQDIITVLCTVCI